MFRVTGLSALRRRRRQTKPMDKYLNKEALVAEQRAHVREIEEKRVAKKIGLR